MGAWFALIGGWAMSALAIGLTVFVLVGIGGGIGSEIIAIAETY